MSNRQCYDNTSVTDMRLRLSSLMKTRNAIEKNEENLSCGINILSNLAQQTDKYVFTI